MLATSLAVGLDDVDLLAIGPSSPNSHIIQRVLGTSTFVHAHATNFSLSSNLITFLTSILAPFSNQHDSYMMTVTPKKRPLEDHPKEHPKYVQCRSI